MSRKIRVNFQDRQIDANFHAEDGLLEQLEAYITTNKIQNINQFRLNLTINNFFCSEQSTGKYNESDNCLDEIIALQKKYKFIRFHVYFQNTYGDKKQISTLIKKLKNVGILVSSFTSTDKPPYVNPLLDPHSESEGDDSDSDSIEDEVLEKHKKNKEDQKNLNLYEQQMVATMLESNNCLINAVARPGLGREANLGELVNIRLAMRDRGFPIGQMLVASPTILDIIRGTLGINRGIIVHYASGEQSDEVQGINPIIIDHENAHFQERKILKIKSKKK
jgi:hypothetical protein